MKFLKVLGWIFWPLIMLIFTWKKSSNKVKIAGAIWTLIIALFLLIPTEDAKVAEDNAQVSSKVADEPIENEAAVVSDDTQESAIVDSEPIQEDWKSKIKEIANSSQSETEKFDQVELELVSNYEPTKEELEAFEQDIIKAFKNKEYLKDITDAEYMLTNIFKSSVIVSGYEDKNEPMPSFAFDFLQNSKYTYRGADAVDSESVKANEDQMEKALEEM